jgi:septation ring formation regulator EzrA
MDYNRGENRLTLTEGDVQQIVNTITNNGALSYANEEQGKQIRKNYANWFKEIANKTWGVSPKDWALMKITPAKPNIPQWESVLKAHSYMIKELPRLD